MMGDGTLDKWGLTPWAIELIFKWVEESQKELRNMMVSFDAFEIY